MNEEVPNVVKKKPKLDAKKMVFFANRRKGDRKYKNYDCPNRKAEVGGNRKLNQHRGCTPEARGSYKGRSGVGWEGLKVIPNKEKFKIGNQISTADINPKRENCTKWIGVGTEVELRWINGGISPKQEGHTKGTWRWEPDSKGNKQ